MNRDELTAALLGQATNEAWLQILAQYFSAHELHYGHGTDNPSDEAFWLLRHLQQWRDGAWEAEPDDRLAERAAELATRRADERVPLAYLLNEAWFAGLKFYVDQRVLVPRSPCAELIERRFEPWCKLRRGDRILDVGTGSGCIAIACAHYCDGVLVDATDASADALAVARRNVEMFDLDERVALIEADLFPPDRRRYRVIISNPPYVSAGQYRRLPDEFRHEPRAGLLGGSSGLEPTLRLLSAAREYLAPDGVLIVEVGNAAATLSRACPTLPFLWLEFSRGGTGVFVLTAQELAHYEPE